MSLKSKRICKCCGKEYEYCPHCGSKNDELWKNLTDTKECLAVFNIVAAYNIGRATAEQVKKVLKENNVNDYSSFAPGIVSALDKACKPSEDPKVEVVVKEQPAPVEEVAIEASEETIPEAKEEIKTLEEKVDEIIPPVVEVQNIPRKIRGGKKKRRQRNTDIEL